VVHEVFLRIFDVSYCVEFFGQSLEFLGAFLSKRLVVEVLTLSSNCFELSDDVAVQGVALSVQDCFLKACLHLCLQEDIQLRFKLSFVSGCQGG